MKRWKKKICLLLLAVVCLVSMFGSPVYAGQSAMPEEQPVRILFIGNSFSKYQNHADSDVGKILGELAESSGRHTEIKMICHNGAYLSYYAFPSADHNSYYKEATDALKNEQWDYIVLQDYSKSGIEYAESRMYPAVRQLNQLVLEYQNNAKVLLYATHGYHDGSATKVNGVNTVLSVHQMQTGVAAAYYKIGKELDLAVVPTGMMFWHCNQVYPSIRLYSEDLKHPSYAGYYLAACMFYYQIFQKLPQGNADSLSGCNLDSVTMWRLEGLVNNRIGISEKEKTVVAGENITLQVSSMLDSYCLSSSFTWQSMDEKIAVTDGTGGTVRGVTVGSVPVMAETKSGLQDFCTINVVENPNLKNKKNFGFQRADYEVTCGDRIKLMPLQKTYSAESNLIWSSSNKAVAKVSADGSVTTLKAGKTTITVKDGWFGSKASYVLYVACKKPQKISVSVKSSGSASSKTGKAVVKWSKIKDASSYIVYRSTAAKGTYKKIAEVSGVSYTDANVLKDRTYYYKVAAKAVYTKTTSEKSGYFAVMIPATPKKVTASCNKKNIKITWTKNKKATGYILYRSVKKNSGYKKIATMKSKNTVSYTDKTAKKGKTYYYRIKAYKKMNGKTYCSASSKTVKAKRLN
ncbi:MAG: DUF4886 domain-containing protein [Eubacterium sp.]|nr:DUF4886 domain-containing protein [Eubacterium sp.]